MECQKCHGKGTLTVHLKSVDIEPIDIACDCSRIVAGFTGGASCLETRIASLRRRAALWERERLDCLRAGKIAEANHALKMRKRCRDRLYKLVGPFTSGHATNGASGPTSTTTQRRTHVRA